MATRAFRYWIATLVILLLMAMAVDIAPAQGDDTLVCQEDEVALPVDYRTPGATEDAVGVTRMCVAVDNLTAQAYEKGYLDGFGAAVDDAVELVIGDAESIAYDHGYGHGYDLGYNHGNDVGYADATREDQEWHEAQPEIACAVIYIVPEPVRRPFGPY